MSNRDDAPTAGLDAEQSFWSVLPADRKRLWAKVRLEDKTAAAPTDSLDGKTESVSIQALIDTPPDSEFGFRSLMLYADRQCRKPAGVNPLLLDLDLGGDDPENLGRLLDRTISFLRERRWEHRCFSSGEGYHVEVSPRGVFRVTPEWAIVQVWVKQVAEQLGAYGLPSGAVIAAPPQMMRMVGSKNRKGGPKLPISRLGS